MQKGLRRRLIYLDKKLKKMAKNGGKELRFVEGDEDVCKLDPTMDSEKVAILLNDALDGYEKCRKAGINPLLEDIEVYKKGLRAIKHVDTDPCGVGRTPQQEMALERAGKNLFHNLLVGRNLKWAPKMDEWMLMEPNKIFAFFFGAAHFDSEGEYANLVQMLTDRGYRIRQINAIEGGSQVSDGGPPVIDRSEDDYEEAIGPDPSEKAKNVGNHSSRTFVPWPFALCFFLCLFLPVPQNFSEDFSDH